METQPTIAYLSTHPSFRSLPRETLRRMAASLTERRAAKGEVLYHQGRSRVEAVWIIQAGKLELFFEQIGEKTLIAALTPGEVFGAISILMNASYAIRTVVAAEDTLLWSIPRELFLDVCGRHEAFYDHFAESFTRRMLDDSYSAMVAASRAIHLLARVVPFSFLPEEVLGSIAPFVTQAAHPRETVVFIQGRSRIEHLHVIAKGAAERYFEENNRKTLQGKMGEGEIYGGISILLNDGIAVRTLKTIEDTTFYLLPKDRFLDLCARHPDFSDYFTDTFGKRMLNRSYAAIITGMMQPKIDSVRLLERTVAGFCRRDLVTCTADLSIQEAAARMSRFRCSSIFVKDETGRISGVVTDNDLRQKVIAKGLDIHLPVSAVMSFPLSTISEQALVFEALMAMMQDNIKHLAVTDADGRVAGVITIRDLLAAQGESPFFLIREITAAESVAELAERYRRLPGIVQAFINSGAKAANITRLVTTISDSILKRLIDLAIAELGPPPARFAFMIMGSEGRKEQTLKTDQDNAIVFEDVPDASLEKVRGYFLSLGRRVCDGLHEVGYDYCQADVMAKNPRLCQPLAVWQDYFQNWVYSAGPKALFQASIFFDFRGAWGDLALTDELRAFLAGLLTGWAGFYRHMAENALHFKPPLGFFRNFVVESKGRHRNVLDIKQAMMPIVDFARIYALKHQLTETNTQERLYQLYLKNVLSWRDYNALEQSYSFLMQLRFVRQIAAVIDEKAKPDNYINPRKLSSIEQALLKEIFKKIEKYQTKLSFEFTGT